MTEPMQFLDAITGHVRGSSQSSADRPIRFAVVDPTYNAFSTYPSAPPPARVTFEGETTLSKAYAVANGFIPWPGTRVYLVPVGRGYLIAGQVNALTPQGFWSNVTGTEAGVEFGGGSFFDTTEGLVIAGDVSVAGDLSVEGVGSEVSAWKPSSTTRTVTTVSADPHLTLNLSAGTWIVDMDLIILGANGDVKTSWLTTGTLDSVYALKTCWGPSPFSVDTAVADETQGRDAAPLRLGAHLYATEVEYGLNSTTNFASARERGMIRFLTAGTLSLGHAQAAADVPSPSGLSGGSFMTARKVEPL